MSNQKGFIDLIKINDSLKEIDLTNLKSNSENNAFILCKYSFINYEVDINKFMNKQLTKDKIQLINHNSPKFNFTSDEIMSFKNTINIYIVDNNYLIHRGINQDFLYSNLFYYIDNGIKYLYFIQELKLFKIAPIKIIKLPNQSNNINNSINNNLMGSILTDINNNTIINNDNTINNNNINNNNIINLNDNKVSILRCLILFYGNERIIKQRLSSNMQNNEIFKCYLVNIDFINNFKNKFNYSKIYNIFSTNNYNYDNFNYYLNYLNIFQSLPEIQETLKSIKDNDIINNIRILPARKNFTNNNEYKWPINFELVHEELFKRLLNIYKISEKEINEIKTYQSQYKVYFGHQTLYINYLKNPIYFFAYNINNNSYNLFAILKCHINIFHALLNKHLKSMTFEKVLIQNKIDLNKKNIPQQIINSQKQKILEVILFSENNIIDNSINNNIIDKNINNIINNDKEEFKNIIDSNMNNSSELDLNNIMKIDNIQNNTITEIKKELNHCLGLENIGATCYMNATIQCLCHIRSLKEYFKNNNNFNDKARLTKCFCELINSLWTESDKGYFTPTNFKNLISELNPLFQGIQANDSKDLIIFIYETIHNELNNPSENNNYLNNLNNIPEELKLFRESYYAKNNSIISKIFYSEQSSNLKCSSCGVNKLSFNIISFLIFPLEKVRQQLIKQKKENLIYVTLEDCFEQNENKEKLFGPNQIFCNSCHRSSDAVSYNRLYNCPEVLTIILNRGKGLEFDVEFKFPMYINIQKYVEEKNSNTNYELIGLITHLGESGMSGHFIAYCKSPVNNNWYCYNDSQVTKCVDPENEINSCGIPYVLFYQKVNLSIPITYDKTPEDVVKDNTNNKKGFVLYFTYEGKEGYIELNGDDLFQNVINKIYMKYEWVPRTGVGFLLQRGDKMTEIESDKTISQNDLKYGEKIIIA